MLTNTCPHCMRNEAVYPNPESSSKTPMYCHSCYTRLVIQRGVGNNFPIWAQETVQQAANSGD